MSEDWSFLDGILAEWKSRGISTPGFREEMQRSGFWLAGVANEQFLTEVHGLLGDAMLHGTGLRDLTPELQKLLDKYGGQVKLHGATERAKSAYKDLMLRNATQSSFAGGRYTEMFSEDWMQLAPFWRYSAVRDARTRPSHAALHGRVFRKDDPAARRYLPPWSHNCRCQAHSLTLDELEQGGYPVSSGGEIEQLPTSDGKFVGKPEGSWDVDRANQAQGGALGEVRDPGGSSAWNGPAPTELPIRPASSPPALPPLENADKVFPGAKEIRLRTEAEEIRVYGPDGVEVWRAVGPPGPPFRVPIPKSVEPIVRGNSVLHGHPPGGPLSLFNDENKGDLATAIGLDLKEIMATGEYGRNQVLSRMSRPAAGWPDLSAASLAAALARVDLDESEWAKGWSAWVEGISGADLRRRALLRYQTELEWEVVRLVCSRLKIPYGVILTP